MGVLGLLAVVMKGEAGLAGGSGHLYEEDPRAGSLEGNQIDERLSQLWQNEKRTSIWHELLVFG